MKENIRQIRYSDFPDIEDKTMSGAWSSWPRKKTVDNNIIKLLKIDDQKAINQVIVNNLKPIFTIRPMDLELVFDTERNQYGLFVKWEEYFCHIGKATAWMGDTENMRHIAKIVLFDSIIGNNDRMVTNVLFLRDYTILGIDEGECFRFASPMKCQFKKEIRNKLNYFVSERTDLFKVYVRGLMDKIEEIEDVMQKDNASKEVIANVKKRVAMADQIFMHLFGVEFI
jgi:hypothetical protein